MAMSRQRIVTLFLVAVSLALLAHFLLIWVFGEYIAYENNKLILVLETLFVIGAFGTGLIEFIRSALRMKPVPRKILALEPATEDANIRILEQNDDFWKLNWQFALRNHSVHSLKFDVLVKYFGMDGSIIHNDFVSNLTVAPNCKSVFSDCTMVPSAIAEGIAHARVEIVQRANRKRSRAGFMQRDSGVPSLRPVVSNLR